jgi:glucosamine 6-phosphate synthetase-like amidotransferase/phosphosugar isomerase protein
MEEKSDSTKFILGYNKFIELRNKQAIANKKYRATENGRLKKIQMHRAWILTKKDDMEYKNNTNLKQRERYKRRKLKKIAESTESTESTEKEISLGENDSQNI